MGFPIIINYFLILPTIYVMKPKFVFYFIAIVLLGLWLYKQHTHVYLAQCGDSQFQQEILERLQFIAHRQIQQKNLPLYQNNQTMQQYDYLQIQVANITTQQAATRKNPVAQCLATLKMSPQTHIQKTINLAPLIKQHHTVWQPETQTTTLLFTANNNRDSLTEAVQMDWQQLEEIVKLPTELVLAWNERANQTLPATPPKSSPRPQNTTPFVPAPPKPKPKPTPPATESQNSFTEAEFKKLSERDQKAVLSKEISDLILGLTPAERQTWFKQRNENKASLWSCQFKQNCTVEQLQAQKRVLQKIRKNH